MAFNLKGLLQDEEFLFAAGLLQQGSQGKSIGEGAFSSLIQAGKIKKSFQKEVDKVGKIRLHSNLQLESNIDHLFEELIDNDKVEVEIADNVTVEVIRGTGIQSLMNSQEVKK